MKSSRKPNKKDALIYTAFSKTGIYALGKLMKDKYGCTIMTQPEYDEKRGMWVISLIDHRLI